MVDSAEPLPSENIVLETEVDEVCMQRVEALATGKKMPTSYETSDEQMVFSTADTSVQGNTTARENTNIERHLQLLESQSSIMGQPALGNLSYR